MMSWKKRPWSWKAGWSAIRKSSWKSRSGRQLRNSANQSLNAKDAKVFAKDAEEIYFETFAIFAFEGSLVFTAYCLLLTAYWIVLPHGRAAAPSFLAEPTRAASCSTTSFAI